jgi:hypothetical protein
MTQSEARIALAADMALRSALQARDSRGRFQRADRGLSVDVAETPDIDGMGDYDTGIWPEFPAWAMAPRPTVWQRIRRWARGAK